MLFLCTDHEVHTFDMLDTFRLQLGIAPRDDDESARVLLHQSADGLPALMVSHLRDAARIDDDDVSRLTLLHRPHTVTAQLLADSRSLGEIQLATQREVGRFLSLQNRGVNHFKGQIYD